MQTKCIRGHSNATAKRSHKPAYAHFIHEQSCKPHAEVSYPPPPRRGALPGTENHRKYQGLVEINLCYFPSVYLGYQRGC